MTITLKMADKGKSDFYVAFTREPLHTWIKTDVHKFAISRHTALKLASQALSRYLKLICEYGPHILPNRDVGAAKDHGKN